MKWLIEKRNSGEWLNKDEIAYCKNNAEEFKDVRFVRKTKKEK